MSVFRDKAEILTPTTASMMLSLGTIVLLVLVLLITRGESGLTALLVGSNASEALQVQAGQDTQATINTIFGNQLLGRAVVFGAWAFVGFMTLMLITVIQSIISDIRETEAELEYVNQNRQEFVRQLTRKFLFRLGVSVVWGLYTIIFFRFIITFFVAAAYVSIVSSSTVMSYMVLLVAALALALAVHVHVVLARLFAGRVRLWEN